MVFQFMECYDKDAVKNKDGESKEPCMAMAHNIGSGRAYASEKVAEMPFFISRKRSSSPHSA